MSEKPIRADEIEAACFDAGVRHVNKCLLAGEYRIVLIAGEPNGGGLVCQAFRDAGWTVRVNGWCASFSRVGG